MEKNKSIKCCSAKPYNIRVFKITEVYTPIVELGVGKTFALGICANCNCFVVAYTNRKQGSETLEVIRGKNANEFVRSFNFRELKFRQKKTNTIGTFSLTYYENGSKHKPKHCFSNLSSMKFAPQTTFAYEPLQKPIEKIILD